MQNSETKICQNCRQNFVIEPEDFAFYKKIKVPPPTWCPQCRLMRRLAWRNERALYKRQCDMCKKNIVAMYSADTPFTVYCRECWWSDNWDAATYGRDYDFSRPFFEQFRELLKVVPQIAAQVSNCPGSDYINQAMNCKNCYLLAGGSYNEDCMYSFRILNAKRVVDSSFVEKLESSYQCVQCMESANLYFSEDCIGSLNLYFCTDVHGSQNCFMSSNLRRGKNIFRNQKLSKEEFLERMKTVDTGSYKNLSSYIEEFNKLRRSRLHKYMAEKNAKGCTGNAISNSKNSKHCFVSGDLENCRYCWMNNNAKDTFDINNGCCIMELIYECSTGGGNTYNVKFSADVWPEARNITYSQSCRNGVNNLFGCVSMRNKEYCILNKQYTKEEYEKIIPKIIEHMNEVPYMSKIRSSKSEIRDIKYKYGEFFPPELSIFAYNESPAQDCFPKTKSKAENACFRWKDIKPKHYEITVYASDLPDHIKDVSEDITKQIVGCLHEGKCEHQCPAAFRITPSELQFYRKMNIALPRLCSNCRHYKRFIMINPYQLWKRQCQCSGETRDKKHEMGEYKNTASHFHGAEQCPNEFETSYAPERPEIVYCEACYNSEVA